jgi:hypothetical protein
MKYLVQFKISKYFKAMCFKTIFYFALFFALSSGCGFFNRMTSPEVLDKKEKLLYFGVSIDPLEMMGQGEVDSELAIVQPVFGYRAGLGSNREIGITVYGVYFPGIVLDIKRKYINKEKFKLSGNLAAFIGYVRPIGFQYDLLFGTKKIYGVTGISYDFVKLYTNKPILTIGFGSERIGDSAFGVQFTYSRSLSPFRNNNSGTTYNYAVNFLSIGLKFDFIKIKKKYRTNK